jgi:adenylosuccinate lyase
MWTNVESSQGLIFSQQVLLALVDRGLPREEAYKIVQKNAGLSWDRNEDFRELVKADAAALAYLSVTELDQIFDYRYYVRYVDDIFQRLGLLAPKVSV